MRPEDAHARIAVLRHALDHIDEEILDLLQARARVVAEVWAIKRAAGLPLKDAGRERQILERLLHRNAGTGLDPQVVEAVFRAVLGATLERPPEER